MNAKPLLFTCAVIFGFALTCAATTHYVDANGSNPTPPYLDWSTAATNIQDAVDASVDGDLVLVTNGVYATGGETMDGFALTNRVVVDQAITVQSVNGPAATVIQGYAPPTTNGPSAVRCVWLTNNATLTGFTVSGGATLAGGDTVNELSGGGIWCSSTNSVISNCVVISNACIGNGGGAYQGTLLGCTLIDNFAKDYGGGSYASVLSNCVVTGNLGLASGGGAYSGTLYNCTVSENAASIQLASAGGGISFATVVNCLVYSNSANVGGGVYLGTILNSAIFDNTAVNGGGADLGTAVNSTFVGNIATAPGPGEATGGLLYTSATNCIIYFNSSQTPNFANNGGAALDHCCTFPMPSSGTGNITNDPALASVTHISINSPCRGAGNAAVTTGVDIDGEPWANPPSIGCDELYPGTLTNTPVIDIVATYTNVPAGYSNNFVANISGELDESIWDFGDGTRATNVPVISHIWPAVGTYPVTLYAFNDSYPAGLSNVLTINYYIPSILYVMTNSKTPIAPYDSWAKAATNIQSAIDAAYTNDVILVSNGLYNTGSRTNIDRSTNRILVWQPVTLQSLNGPAVTTIDGGSTMRCVYLTNGANLVGFTISNGSSANGGGIFSTSSNNLISTCLITACRAATNGGGLYGGTATNCTFTRNSGTAAYLGILQNCVVGPGNSGPFSAIQNCLVSNCLVASNKAGVSYSTVFNSLITSNAPGGGAANSTLVNCTISSNSAFGAAGAYECFSTNCLFFGNIATDGEGGGVGGFVLANCTVVSNTSTAPGGGVADCFATNCIIYYNSAGGSGSTFANYAGPIAVNCCTFPLPISGFGNFTNPPLFVNPAAADFHLQSTSPCINAGNNTAVTTTTDFDGNPRIVGGTVDVGAYEYQMPTSVISYAWLQQYGLPTDGSVDYADLDGTSFNVYQDWVAGLNPTNALSILALLPPAFTNSTGVSVSWQSVANETYYLERATNLATVPAFAPLQSNLVGQASVTTFIDTTATNSNNYFYRVGIQQPYANISN